MLSTIIYSGLVSNSFIVITLPNREWTQRTQRKSLIASILIRSQFPNPASLGGPRSGFQAASPGPTQESTYQPRMDANGHELKGSHSRLFVCIRGFLSWPRLRVTLRLPSCFARPNPGIVLSYQTANGRQWTRIKTSHLRSFAVVGFGKDDPLPLEFCAPKIKNQPNR